jgi:hypothetical protein
MTDDLRTYRYYVDDATSSSRAEYPATGEMVPARLCLVVTRHGNQPHGRTRFGIRHHFIRRPNGGNLA